VGVGGAGGVGVPIGRLGRGLVADWEEAGNGAVTMTVESEKEAMISNAFFMEARNGLNLQHFSTKA